MFRASLCSSSGATTAVAPFGLPSEIGYSIDVGRGYKSNQQDGIILVNLLLLVTSSVLHVLGNVFAHHQEHWTVFTVSGSVHPSCCWLVSWVGFNSSKTPAGRNMGEHYQIL
jgi:hypothetical protein